MDKQEIKLLALEYFGETDMNKPQKLVDFERHVVANQWPELLENLPQHREDFLLKFLRGGNFDIEKSFQVLKNYVSMIRSGPEYFALAFEPGLARAREVLQNLGFALLPKRDKYHRRVFLWRPGTWDPDMISLGDFYSCGFALMEIISLEEETQIAGVSVVCDSVDFGFKQLKNTSVGDLKFLSMFAQDHFPLWIRSVHCINVTYVISLAYKLLRPFLNERVQNIINFHNNLDSLQEQISPNVLPSELSGQGRSLKDEEGIDFSTVSDYFKDLKKYIFND